MGRGWNFKQKVFVTHYEAQIPLVDYGGATDESISVRAPEFIHQLGSVQPPHRSEVTWRLVCSPLFRLPGMPNTRLKRAPVRAAFLPLKAS